MGPVQTLRSVLLADRPPHFESQFPLLLCPPPMSRLLILGLVGYYLILAQGC